MQLCVRFSHQNADVSSAADLSDRRGILFLLTQNGADKAACGLAARAVQNEKASLAGGWFAYGVLGKA